MKSFLSSVGLLLPVVIHQAQAIPKCHLSVSGWNINGMFAPYGPQSWRLLKDDSTSGDTYIRQHTDGNFRFFDSAGHPDDRAFSAIHDPYDSSAECLKATLLHKAGSLFGSDWPHTYIYPVDSPIKAPYLGRYRVDPASKESRKLSETAFYFDGCYKFGRDKHADGVEWNYKSHVCNAVWHGNVTDVVPTHTGPSPGYKWNSPLEDHWRAQEFTPLSAPHKPHLTNPYPGKPSTDAENNSVTAPLNHGKGSTYTRFHAGSYVKTLEQCEDMAKDASSKVSVVSLSSRGDCYYAIDDHTIDASSKSNWSYKVIDYTATTTAAEKKSINETVMKCSFI